jgi:hypothetical protein
VPGDDPEDVLDPDPLGFAGADEVRKGALGQRHRDRLAGQLVGGDEAIDGAVKVAAVTHHHMGDVVDHRRREVDAEAGGRLPGAFLDDVVAEIDVKTVDRDNETAAEPRFHSLVEHFEIARRAVGGDHDLLGAREERAEGVAELGCGLSLQELHVVDEEQVDPPQPVLEGERRLALHRLDEVVHKVVGRQVDDVAARVCRARRPGDRVKKVRLPKADRRMDIDRVEGHRIVERGMRDLLCHTERHFVGQAGNESVEGHSRIDRGP